MWGGLLMAQVALDHELHGARNRADCKIIWFRPSGGQLLTEQLLILART